MSWIPLLALLGLVQPCPECTRAEELLAEGDTAEAVSLLRGAVETDWTAEAAGRLGMILVETASSRAVEWSERAEAESLLRAAIEEDGQDPRWWYALGLLERSRGGKADAIRFLTRAEELADADPDAISARDLSRIYTERGKAREERFQDFVGFIAQNRQVPIVGSTGCGVAFCVNYERPHRFYDILFSFDTQDSLAADERVGMARNFGTAFDLDPSYPEAARSYLGFLAREGEWEQFVDVAGSHLHTSGREGWPEIFLGAGLYRIGETERADSVFSEALDVLGDDERDILEDVSILLRRRQAEAQAERGSGGDEFRDLLWTTQDPLLSTEVNERRLEHYTRVALAELWFGDPRIEERGALTDPGTIYIRYGLPRYVRQIRIDDDAAQAIEALGVARPVTGGRFVLWIYSMDTPAFVFEKQLGSRRMFLSPTAQSAEYVQSARDRQPSSYQLPRFQALPHQVIRFKGGERSEVEADIVLSLPAPAGAIESTAEIPARAGFYHIPQRVGGEVIPVATDVDLARVGGDPATFRIPLDRGQYPYSVEVVSDDAQIRSANRGLIDTSDWPEDDDEIFLSDLMLADRVQPKISDYFERRHFNIVASADQRFESSGQMGIYFEVYGLDAGDDDETGSYEVTVRLTNEEEEGIRGVFQRFTDIFGEEEGPGIVSWESSYLGEPDRRPEWFMLELPELQPGTYVITVQVEGREGRDGSATTARTFTVGSPSTEPMEMDDEPGMRRLEGGIGGG